MCPAESHSGYQTEQKPAAGRHSQSVWHCHLDILPGCPDHGFQAAYQEWLSVGRWEDCPYVHWEWLLVGSWGEGVV